MQVYELIRDRIVRAHYAPGSKLQLIPLSEELEVSTMPVRSALKRLDSEGFVTYRAHKGATVEPLDLDAFEEILEIRLAIESLAARLGAAFIADEDIERMRAVLAELEDPDRTLDEQIALEWQGYLICYEASKRSRLVKLILDQGRLAERYSRAAIGDTFDLRSVEHFRRLIAACEAHDPAEAEAATAAGLRQNLDKLTDYVIRQEGH